MYILDLRGALECTITSLSLCLCQETVPIRDTKIRLIPFVTELLWYKHLPASVAESLVTFTRKPKIYPHLELGGCQFRTLCVCPHSVAAAGCYSQPYLSTWSLHVIMINNDDGAILLTLVHQRNTALRLIFFISAAYSADIKTETAVKRWYDDYDYPQIRSVFAENHAWHEKNRQDSKSLDGVPCCSRTLWGPGFHTTCIRLSNIYVWYVIVIVVFEK